MIPVRSARQFAKFALVGLSGVVVNLAVFAAVLWIVARVAAGTPWLEASLSRPADPLARAAALLANAMAFALSVLSNYGLHRRWTFRSRATVAREMPRFVLVSVIAYALQLAVFAAALVLLPVGRTVCQLLSIACVMPVNYLANRRWSFRAGSVARPEVEDQRAQAA